MKPISCNQEMGDTGRLVYPERLLCLGSCTVSYISSPSSSQHFVITDFMLHCCKITVVI